MPATLFQKVWDRHAVRRLPNGQTQLYVGLHLVHEVTSPQAFDELRTRGWRVRAPERTFATVDHIVPTRAQARPFRRSDGRDDGRGARAELPQHGIPLFDLPSGSQGIVHVIGPELGLTQPGMTIVCGDSHTSTHGAFGALAFGIGTSQVRDVLASQSIAMSPLNVRRIDVNGRARAGRLRQRRDPLDHRPARHQGRRGIRVRVRRRHDRAHVDGRAHDDLQHVDRRRRAHRLRESRRDDVRVLARPPICAEGRRVRSRRGVVAGRRVRSGRARTTIAS